MRARPLDPVSQATADAGNQSFRCTSPATCSSQLGESLSRDMRRFPRMSSKQIPHQQTLPACRLRSEHHPIHAMRPQARSHRLMIPPGPGDVPNASGVAASSRRCDAQSGYICHPSSALAYSVVHILLCLSVVIFYRNATSRPSTQKVPHIFLPIQTTPPIQISPARLSQRFSQNLRRVRGRLRYLARLSPATDCYPRMEKRTALFTLSTHFARLGK